MSLLTRTYTFTDGTTAYGSQVDSEIANIVNTINSLDQAGTSWTNVKATTITVLGSIAMSGMKITGLANGTASTDAVAYQQISGVTIVTGSIIMYPLKTPPSGYLYCDGSAVSRGTYATLYGIIGNTFGSGDGSTTFKLPDYRGKFLRGVNDSSGNDPDASSRTAQASGGNSGDAAGSIQAEGFKTHTNSITDPTHGHRVAGASNGSGNVGLNTGPGPNRIPGSSNFTTGQDYYNSSPGSGPAFIEASSTGITSSSSGGGNETRPINAAIYFHIKS